jgi:hypothetical protein
VALEDDTTDRFREANLVSNSVHSTVATVYSPLHRQTSESKDKLVVLVELLHCESVPLEDNKTVTVYIPLLADKRIKGRACTVILTVYIPLLAGKRIKRRVCRVLQ